MTCRTYAVSPLRSASRSRTEFSLSSFPGDVSVTNMRCTGVSRRVSVPRRGTTTRPCCREDSRPAEVLLSLLPQTRNTEMARPAGCTPASSRSRASTTSEQLTVRPMTLASQDATEMSSSSRTAISANRSRKALVSAGMPRSLALSKACA